MVPLVGVQAPSVEIAMTERKMREKLSAVPSQRFRMAVEWNRGTVQSMEQMPAMNAIVLL
jgi:hypothetical protein